jgi:5-methyltetrahydropteroyltriglutamate--homocysteine methyltransferase
MRHSHSAGFALPITPVPKITSGSRLVSRHRPYREDFPPMLFRPTIAGSLPTPGWLAEPEKLWPKWRLEGADLERAKRDAALVWIKEQEGAGIEIVSDGEQFRTHFVHGFLEHVDGIDWNLKTPMGIRNNRYTVEVPTVTGPVKRKRSVHRDEAAFCRSHTLKGLKFTLPGPMTICDTIADAHYGRRADMAMAFAEILNEEAKELEAAGCDTIQFDEPAFNVFMEEVNAWGVAALERAAEGLNCTTAVHICYGYGIEANIRWKETLGSEWRQYEQIFPALNDSSIQQVSLECANSRVPISLIGLLSKKDLLIGAIDVASNRVESPEDVAMVLKAALAHADPERVYPCTNCGLAPLSREIAVGKLRALGQGALLLREEYDPS